MPLQFPKQMAASIWLIGQVFDCILYMMNGGYKWITECLPIVSGGIYYIFANGMVS